MERWRENTWICPFGPFRGCLFLCPVGLGTENRLGHTIGQLLQHSGLDVFQHRHFLEQANILEGTGDARVDDLMSLLPVHPLTVQVERALRGLIHAGDQVEHRGLARAVEADQAHQLRLTNLNIEVADRFQSAELNAQILAPQHGGGFCLSG